MSENSALTTAGQAFESKKIALHNEVETLQTERSSHIEKINALEEEKHALETDLASQKDGIAALENYKSEIEKEKLALQQDKIALGEKIRSLEVENMTLADGKAALEKDKYALEEKNYDLQTSWERMQKDNARLRLAFENQLEKTRVRSQEVDTLSTQLSNLGEQLVILDAAKRDADDSLCLATEENSQQADTIDQLSQKVKQLEEDLDTTVKKNRDLESQIVGLTAEKEGLEQALTPLQSENQKLEESNTEQQATILGLRTENERLDVSVKEARERLEKQDDRSYGLTSELGKVTAERDNAQQELAKEADGQHTLKSSLRKANAKVIKLETELSIVQAMMQDARITNAQLSETEQVLNDRVLQLQRSLSKVNEASDTSKSTENNLRSEISALKAHLTTRDGQKKELRSSLRGTQRSLSEATDRISTLETDLLAKDQRIESIRHRLTEEHRLRAGVARELRTQRVKQKELEALEESSVERIAEAERKAAYAVERADDLARDAASAKNASVTLRQRLNEARLEVAKAERRVDQEQEKVRLARVELQEVNRIVDGLDPERTWRQLADEKVGRAADVARLQAEVLAREKELGGERVKLAELGARVKALEVTASHDQCVERVQVRDLVRAVGDLVSQCEVRPRGSRYEWSYPEQLVQRPDDNKWEIKFVKKLAVRRRW